VVAARRFPATPTNTAQGYAPDYFLDFAFDELRKINPAQHAVTVLTTIDVGIQQRAEDAVEGTLRQYGAEYNVSQGSIVVTEPEGAVRAMVGGRDYGASQFNRAVTSARQPGSSFKPFVYAVALENGFKPTSAVVDQPTCIGNWCPKNYAGRFSGRTTLMQALTVSINTVPVQLTRTLGRETVARAAAAMGVNVPAKPDWPFVLGAVDTNPYEMAGGYATFANGGYAVAPYAIDQIMGVDGAVIWDRKRDAPPKKRVLGAEAVGDLNAMMRNVVVAGTGKRTQVPGVPIAGKTGTTSAYRDAWFVGYSGNYVASVWFGNDDYRPMNRVTGGFLPAIAFQSVMAFAHQNVDVKPLFGVPFEPGMGTTAPVAAAPGTDATTDVSASLVTVARPRALSSRAASVLMSIAEQIEKAPPVKPRPEAANRPGQKRADARGLTPVAGEGGLAPSGGLTALR
jgi:penicillin-binding protein 1A